MKEILQIILNHLIHFLKSVRFFPIEAAAFIIIFALAVTHTAYDTQFLLLISCCFLAFSIRTATLHPNIERFRRIAYFSILIPLFSIPFISLSGDEKIVAGIFILSVVLPFLAKNLKDRKSFAKHFLSILGDILIAILIISPSLILIVSPLYTSGSHAFAKVLGLITLFLFIVGIPVIFFFRQLTPGEKRPFSSTFFYILTNLILSPLAILCTICVYLSTIAILSGCEINSDTPLIIMIVYFILVFIARKGHDVTGIHFFDRFFDNIKYIIIVPIIIYWILLKSLLTCSNEDGWKYLNQSWLYFYIGIFMIAVVLFLLFKKKNNNTFLWWVGLIFSELIIFVPPLSPNKTNARLCMCQVDNFLENNKLIDSTGYLTQDTICETDFDSHEFHRFNNARITVYCNDSTLLANKNPYVIYKDWQDYQPKQNTETEVEIKKDTAIIEVKKDTATIYTKVEKMAEYIGGKESLVRDIKNNLVYPQKAKEEMIEGRVIIKFVVKKDGSTCCYSVVRSSDSVFEQAALQAVTKLGKWEPARNNGKPVNSYFTLPVTFRLKDVVR